VFTLCDSATVLREQINKRWPLRNKRRDGWIGLKNNHQPDDQERIFALDIDENLLGPMHEIKDNKQEAQRLADELIQLARRGKDFGRIKYVAYDKKIASGTQDNNFWVWRPLRKGFEKHIHVSFNDIEENNDKPFFLKIFMEEPPEKEKNEIKIPKYPGSDKLVLGKRNSYVKAMQEKLISKGFHIDQNEIGRYQSTTASAVANFYRSIGVNSGTIAREGNKLGFKAWERLFGE
jgi:hypothetical protein